MVEEDFIKKLKNCFTSKDIHYLMKEKEYPNTFGSKFEDNYFKLEDNQKNATTFNINTTGLFKLAFKTIFFLKVHGELRFKPQGSGTMNYANALQLLLKKISDKTPNIRSLEDIGSDIIDIIIDDHKNNKKNPHVQTLTSKLNYLDEWIKYANNKLPYFLRLNPSLLNGSTKYSDLRLELKENNRERRTVGGAKVPYPLYDLKKLIKCSMEYIEIYSKDCLIAAKLYKETKKMSRWESYSHAVNYFRNTPHLFTEPSLKEVQNSCKSLTSGSLSFFKNNQGKLVKAPIGRCIEAARKLEGSCAAIILMMTSMRSSELALLDRNPLITQDEHYNLKRLVYKTSKTKHGKELIMPIPPITKSAIEIMSKLNETKDGKKDGYMIISDIRHSDKTHVGTRLVNLLKHISKYAGVKSPPLPHDLRHAMAFLIVHINEKDGLELARMFLGHTSITMTLQYMGHFNLLMKEAINELQKDESNYLVGIITNEIKDGKKLFGRQGERLMGTHNFIGSYANELMELVSKSLLGLIEKGQVVILQTPVALCIHDTTSTEKMSCQQGFHITDLIGQKPIPSRCVGANCSSAIFTENSIIELKEQTEILQESIPEAFRERLLQHTYFLNDGGFNELSNPYNKLIRDYDEYKKEA